MTIADIMQTAPVIPVIVVDEVEQAEPLAQALVAGGLRVLEVTLRTPAALEAIRIMRGVEGAIVGAGTVTNQRELADAIDAGSEFIVSPGLTEPLGKAAIRESIPFLPGIANAGDIMRGLDLGLTHFKFFPAMAAGGLPALKALADISIVPVSDSGPRMSRQLSRPLSPATSRATQARKSQHGRREAECKLSEQPKTKQPHVNKTTKQNNPN